MILMESYNINPLTVSKICWYKAYRHGAHPFYIKTLRKGFWKTFNLNNLITIIFYDDMFYGFYPAKVEIYGADGSRMYSIRCKSNERAKRLKEKLWKEVEEYVKSLPEKPS